MAAWGHAAAVPVDAPIRRPRPSARPVVRKPTPRSAGLLGGVVWIGVLAALLAGIVALNVAVLQLNVRLDRIARERAELNAANATLSSELSRGGTTAQVAALARGRLGLVPADPEQTRYIRIRPAK